MWKLFARAFPMEFIHLSPRHVLKKSPFRHAPTMPTRHYLELVSADELAWGTILTAPTELFTLPELFDLARVTNLVALEISSRRRMLGDNGDGVTLTDRTIRIWSEMADSGTAFKHLQFLVLRNQSELTEVSLGLLDRFPSLRAVLAVGNPRITRTKRLKSGEKLGWEGRKEVAARADLDSHFSKLILDGTLDAPGGAKAVPYLITTLPGGEDMPAPTETQRWYTRREINPLSTKRRVEDTPMNNAKRQKKPTLRAMNSKHMQENLNLALEFLG
jgi:hypothetical protein